MINVDLQGFSSCEFSIQYHARPSQFEISQNGKVRNKRIAQGCKNYPRKTIISTAITRSTQEVTRSIVLQSFESCPVCFAKPIYLLNG